MNRIKKFCFTITPVTRSLLSWLWVYQPFNKGWIKLNEEKRSGPIYFARLWRKFSTYSTYSTFPGVATAGLKSFKNCFFVDLASYEHSRYLPVHNRNTRARCEICSKSTINILKRHRSDVFIVNFFTPCYSVSIVNFENVVAGWKRLNLYLIYMK